MDILRISMNCDYYKENISDSIKNFNSFEEILMAYAFYAMLKDCMEYIDEEIFDQIVKEIEAEEEGKE